MIPIRRPFVFAFALGLAVLGSWTSAAPAGEYLVYFGTYTGFHFTRKGVPTGQSQSRGIYFSRFRPATGEVTQPELAAEIVNPSFFAIDPNRRFLYSLSEDPHSLGPTHDKGSFVKAFAINPATGKLALLNTVSAGGASTCHISIDKSGRNVLVTNFGSGSISVLRVKQDGSLGDMSAHVQHTGTSVDPFYQTQPHPHSINLSPDNRFVLVADLGTDKVLVYRFDEATGSLTLNDPPFAKVKPGSGPRHFVFHPSGRFGYLMNEMGGTVIAFAWDAARGVLTQIQETSTVPPDFRGEDHSAEVVIDSSGRFLYDSNRGPDTIAVLSIDAVKGTLAPLQQESTRGIMPRSFDIDPTGSYLFAANQATDNVVLFRVDSQTGRLSPTRTVLKIDAPVCVKFLPAE